MGEEDASTDRTARGRGLRAAPLVALLAALGQPPGHAQEVDGFVELTGSRSRQETRIDSGPSREVQPSSFFQRYNANVTWLLYPNLQLALGALYERDDSVDDSTDVDVTEETLRPYVDLSLRTPFLSADVGYYRLENRQQTDGLSFDVIRDSLNATVDWRPDRAPEWILTMVRTDSHDEDRQVLDVQDTLLDLVMEYAPIQSLEIRYRGGRQHNENQIEDVDFRLSSHAGRLTYGDTFWERRLLVSAEYNVNYQKREFFTDGGAQVLVPVLPAAGLSANDDIPTDVVLAPNPALTDGDRAASAGINLGLPPPGGDDALRNIGLDFTAPANVDTLRVWVDRVLPPEISSSFVWEVYSSANNLDWTLEGVAASTFGLLDTFFELRFDDLGGRYLKVVTSPLDLTNPAADAFPFILVTEMEAFDRVAADEAPGGQGMTAHRLTSSVRVRLLPERNFFYDFSYSGVWPDLQPSTFAVSNALSFSQQVNRVLAVSARAARDDGTEIQGDFVSYPYTTSLRATWLPTLRQSLVFSGVRTDIEGSSIAFDSIYLQTSADLYRGISAQLDLGTSWRETDEERSSSDLLTVSMTLLPNSTLTLNLLYQLRMTDRALPAAGATLETQFDAREVSLSYRPFPALYFFGSYRLEHQDPNPDRTLVDYNVAWSPFPSGSLQITLRYDETYRSELDTSATVSSATVRWNLRKGRYVEASYVVQQLQDVLERRDFDSLQASMRWPF